jgi:hypothetical protein
MKRRGSNMAPIESSFTSNDALSATVAIGAESSIYPTEVFILLPNECNPCIRRLSQYRRLPRCRRAFDRLGIPPFGSSGVEIRGDGFDGFHLCSVYKDMDQLLPPPSSSSSPSSCLNLDQGSSYKYRQNGYPQGKRWNIRPYPHTFGR